MVQATNEPHTRTLAREGIAQVLVRRLYEIYKNTGVEIASDSLRFGVDASPQVRIWWHERRGGSSSLNGQDWTLFSSEDGGYRVSNFEPPLYLTPDQARIIDELAADGLVKAPRVYGTYSIDL